MTLRPLIKLPKFNLGAASYGAAVIIALALTLYYFRINLMLPESADPDEGVYLIVARLLNHGFGYNAFYFDQFWLFPQILAFAFRLFGDTAETGRLTVVAFSLSGLGALAVLARQMGFRWAAPLTILFGAINHYYLAQSRYTMTDVPSAALMLWALVAMQCFGARKQRIWLVVSGALCAGSLLIKPLAIGFVIPLGVWLMAARLERSAGTWRWHWGALIADAGLMVCGGALLAAPFIDLFDLRGEFIRTVGFHWDEKSWYAPQLALRQLALVSYSAENRMWFGLAALGASVAVWKQPLRALPLLAAEIASALVLVQLPPWWHHYALLAPVLILFSGIGAAAGIEFIVQAICARRVRAAWSRKQWAAYALGGAFFFFAAALWLHDAPQLARYNLAVLNERGIDNTRVRRYLERNFPRGTFLLSDDPMALYLAEMLIPPSAINLPYESTFRFSTLSQQKLYESVTAYDVPAIIVTGSYKRNPKLMRWIETQFPLVAAAGGGKSNTLAATIYRYDADQEHVIMLPSLFDDETDADPELQTH